MAGNLSVRVVGTSAFGLDFDCPLTDIKGLDIPRSCPFANMSHLVKTFQLSGESCCHARALAPTPLCTTPAEPSKIRVTPRPAAEPA